MDFQLREEQQQFADALRRWVAKDYSHEARRQIIHSASGVSDSAWQTLVELGMTALPVPEAQGGFSGGAVDLWVVMQELGRGLVVEPYFATVWGAQFLQLAGNQAALLEQVASGELKLACALGEQQSRHDLYDIRTSAVRDGEGYCLNGAKSVVIHGAQAGALIVSARDAAAPDGICLFVVPATAPGVQRRDYRTIDGQRAATVELCDVRLPASALLAQGSVAADLLEQAADYGVTLLCAEAVGAMDALFAATLDYLKTRKQFGTAIGSFQALQHRMADMYIHLEQARSMAMLAAARQDGSDAAERRRAVSAAKVRIGQAAKFIGQQAVQLHGGMGVTDELPAAHLFKRLTMIDLTLGDVDHHLQRFAAQPAFAEHA
ncbi:acyl-CoA dehydrogenase family protein [Pseudoduganella danionis]|uniref:Pimeloyl-CoA dehydrogenase small subunit n=1 Tax=Pseudoduganella danionis TaxID=1890295 RepID=A0ABW9SKX8_9BURK|nr:acyl-CoA dehydrogenase [Pseudoduganella danionis]MTW32692.1 pimeloyl-CoA dehydrogenase small subunit [Pseudoduganella danionis]